MAEEKKGKNMKLLTKALTMFAFGLLFGAIITLNEVIGLLGVGIFAFCFINDPECRRVF